LAGGKQRNIKEAIDYTENYNSIKTLHIYNKNLTNILFFLLSYPFLPIFLPV